APATPAPPKRRRGRLLVAIAAVLAVLVAGWFVFIRDDAPALTWEGDEFEEPEATLEAAEATMRELVDERHGALIDDSRCYFSLPADEDTTDVNDFLRCGPVLFVDDDPEAPFLSFELDERERDGELFLEAADEPESQDPEALDDDEELKRPDGLETPEDDGGIEPPTPPPAEPDLFQVDALDGVDLEAPAGPARIVSRTDSVEIVGLAEPDRVGREDDARTPAEGQLFVAFEATVGTGEVPAPGEAQLAIQIGDEAPQPVPPEIAAASSPTGMLLSVDEDVEVVDLIVTEQDVEQRISLLTGEAGDGNVQVLLRENRSQELAATMALPVNVVLTNGRVVADTLTVTINRVDLTFFDGASGELRPSSPSRAFLVVSQNVTSTLVDLGANTSLGASTLSVILPDGTVATGVDLQPDPTLVRTSVEVPADFTQGTIVVSGSETASDGTIIDFAEGRFEVPVNITAG
ncbi:MAG: hypothetical protein ACRD0G_05055, partial [Acidimicrobiales bacterium]